MYCIHTVVHIRAISVLNLCQVPVYCVVSLGSISGWNNTQGVKVIHHFSNANFYSLQSIVGTKNCKSSEYIRQNVTELHYFAPREACNWQKFAL